MSMYLPRRCRVPASFANRMPGDGLRHPQNPAGQGRILITRWARLFPHRISTTALMRMAYSPMTAVPLRESTMPGHSDTPRPRAHKRQRTVSSFQRTHQAANFMRSPALRCAVNTHVCKSRAIACSEAKAVANDVTDCYSGSRKAVSAALRSPMGQRRIVTSMRIRLFPHRISTTTHMRMASSPMTVAPLRGGTMPDHLGTPRPRARIRRHAVSSCRTHQVAMRSCAKQQHRPMMRAESEQIVDKRGRRWVW
jgi:hypothetical protein